MRVCNLEQNAVRKPNIRVHCSADLSRSKNHDLAASCTPTYSVHKLEVGNSRIIERSYLDRSSRNRSRSRMEITVVFGALHWTPIRDIADTARQQSVAGIIEHIVPVVGKDTDISDDQPASLGQFQVVEKSARR